MRKEYDLGNGMIVDNKKSAKKFYENRITETRVEMVKCTSELNILRRKLNALENKRDLL